MANKTSSLFTSTALAGLLLAGTAGAALVASAQELSGGTDSRRALTIDGFVGSIEIREGNSFDYQLDMGKRIVAEPQIEKVNGGLVVHGGLDKGPHRCNVNGKRFEMQMKGGDKHSIADFPTLIITAPSGSDMALSILGGQVKMDDANSLALDFSGCGDVTFGDITQDLKLNIYGSGDVAGGNTGPAEVRIQGSGDFDMKNIRGPALIEISGSGDVTIGEIAGSSRMQIKGSGDIDIASIESDSDVDLRGSGDVEIERGDVKEFKVNVLGSGDVKFNGGADDVSVLLKGSGDVYVARSNGNRVVSRYGSGDVRIGSWRYDDD